MTRLMLFNILSSPVAHYNYPRGRGRPVSNVDCSHSQACRNMLLQNLKVYPTFWHVQGRILKLFSAEDCTHTQACTPTPTPIPTPTHMHAHPLTCACSIQIKIHMWADMYKTSAIPYIAERLVFVKHLEAAIAVKRAVRCTATFP